MLNVRSPPIADILGRCDHLAMIRWVALFAVPLAVVVGYITFLADRSASMDFAALGIALAAGLIVIWSAPWDRHSKIIGSLGYVPLMGAALIVAAFATECSTGSCL